MLRSLPKMTTMMAQSRDRDYGAELIKLRERDRGRGREGGGGEYYRGYIR